MDRSLEFLIALIIGLVLLPFIATTAAVLLVFQGRPVFFVGTRAGLRGKTFGMVKFRTMREDRANGVTGGDKSDLITPIGRILRSRRLDEFPQIWNVLTGEMALVGPRPPACEFVASVPAVYQRILRVKPGISGLATLVMHRFEASVLEAAVDPIDVDRIYRRRCLWRKARLDAIYSSNRSIANDLWIVALTALWAVGGLPKGRLPRKRKRMKPLRNAQPFSVVAKDLN